MQSEQLQRENDFMRKLLAFVLVGDLDQIKLDVARNSYCTIKASTCEHEWHDQPINPNVQGKYSVCESCKSVLFEGSDKPLLGSDAFQLVELKKIATDEYQRQMADIT